jgi:hypothetical protein
MQLFGLVCVLAYCVVASVVAVRMLRLAGRTGQLPERLIGAALLVGGGVSYPVTVAAVLLAPSAPELARRLLVAGTLGLSASTWTMLLVWRSVFHPGERWSLRVEVAITGVLLASLVDRLAALDLAALSLAAGQRPSAGYVIALVLQAVPFALNALSGFRHHGRLRRRIALGLADPVVANRIWLWAMTSVVVVLQYAWSIGSAAFGFGTDPRSSGAVIGSLGLTLSLLLTLAFLPPKAYLRWLAARGEKGAESRT